MPTSLTAWDRWYRRMLPAYWVFLFCATHLPRPSLPVQFAENDKLVHFLAFGLLAFLFWRFARTFNRDLSPRFVWLALVSLMGYAALDEYLQQFVNRSTSFIDWLADLAGTALVLAVLEAHRRRSAHRRHAGPQPQ